MKTERRHELHENLLAKQLSTGYEKARPYTFTVSAAAIVAAVLILGYSFFSGQSQEKTAKAWEAYFDALTPGTLGQDDSEEKLKEVIKDYGDTPVADWARLAAADRELNHGIQLQFRDQSAAATRHFNTALADYNSLLQKSPSSDIRQRAAFRLAITYEALGKVEEARKAYAEVQGAFKPIAERRSKELDAEDVREFYDWYVKAELPGAVAPGDPGTPGKRPPFSVDEPGDSPLRLPGDSRDFTAPTDPSDVKLPSVLDDLPSGDAPAKGKPPEPPAESSDEPTPKSSTDDAPESSEDKPGADNKPGADDSASAKDESK
jgi:predicted negative regulator of RcsB-dependent stress response